MLAITSQTPDVVWQPTDPEATAMSRYRHHVNRKFNQSFRNTQELQRWSVDESHAFWTDVYGYLDLVPSLGEQTSMAYEERPMREIPRFFPDLRLNYAENVFRANRQHDETALIEIREDQPISPDAAHKITWREFRARIRETASALKASGIKEGDRVGAIVAVSSWAVVLFYAAASMGAIFTSISPEIGAEGCISRLRQVTPNILFVDSHVLYNGKLSSTTEKIRAVTAGLKQHVEVFIVSPKVSPTLWPSIDEFLRRANPDEPLEFRRLPFHYPLMICYSSGTTGAPKCIVHQHGLILQHKKNSVLHNNLSNGDVVMQYSSTSWVVFYTMCSQLSAGAAIVVYNGSPLYPDSKQLLRICEAYKVTYLGVSPRLLLEIEMSRTIPKTEFDLSHLRMVFTTGAPLTVEQYRWFYRNMPSEVQISNTAGGTDTATVVIGVDPCGPVRAGEMQILALGMDVDILDQDTGESIAHTGAAGEMVIRKPFPSMPCCFWGDVGRKIYRAAYFERFPTIDCWAVHDWLSQNPKTGGYVMHGRSDGVLNPSGIRFGSSEIYNIIETTPFTDYISNSLCVGRRRSTDSDEQVFLFLVMRPGSVLDEDFRVQVKAAIRNALSPRHVPRYVLAVPDIPMTINGKRIETAIKKILSGEEVKPSSTVQNPNSLPWFKRYRDIEAEPRRARL